MDVVYSSNENYVRHLAVSMYSLMDRNQAAERIRVFILSSGITSESRERLFQIAEHFGREIVWIPAPWEDFLWELRCRMKWSVCFTWTAIP